MLVPRGVTLFITIVGAPSFRGVKGPGVSKGRGCSWGTLRIPFGKVGEH